MLERNGLPYTPTKKQFDELAKKVHMMPLEPVLFFNLHKSLTPIDHMNTDKSVTRHNIPKRYGIKPTFNTVEGIEQVTYRYYEVKQPHPQVGQNPIYRPTHLQFLNGAIKVTMAKTPDLAFFLLTNPKLNLIYTLKNEKREAIQTMEFDRQIARLQASIMMEDFEGYLHDDDVRQVASMMNYRAAATKDPATLRIFLWDQIKLNPKKFMEAMDDKSRSVISTVRDAQRLNCLVLQKRNWHFQDYVSKEIDDKILYSVPRFKNDEVTALAEWLVQGPNTKHHQELMDLLAGAREYEKESKAVEADSPAV